MCDTSARMSHQDAGSLQSCDGRRGAKAIDVKVATLCRCLGELIPCSHGEAPVMCRQRKRQQS